MPVIIGHAIYTKPKEYALWDILTFLSSVGTRTLCHFFIKLCYAAQFDTKYAHIMFAAVALQGLTEHLALASSVSTGASALDLYILWIIM